MSTNALPMYLYYERVFYKSEQRIRDQIAELVGCNPRYVTGVRNGWND